MLGNSNKEEQTEKKSLMVCQRPPMGGEQAVTYRGKVGIIAVVSSLLDGLPPQMGDNNAESRCVS